MAHIDFCQNKLLIVWDKYLEIVEIDLLELEPTQFNIRTRCHFFLAENSLAAGFLSDTLIYQFSRSGLRVYSSNKFRPGSGSGAQSQSGQLTSAEIFFRDLSIDRFPLSNSFTSGLLVNAQPPAAELKRFYQGISTTLRNRRTDRQTNHNSLVFVYGGQL